ncbi:hypothetical protein Tel_05235 [Candidatus Tenderia electrophaga]|jgi:uncharacterized membrane protein SpoIIM required for sporulation|uniref:Stage II sporulation protein M n=1 Tax=Candidatus Tenderia electrophaga TaxID=1748243 RepID=A0A0S2TBR3_9GAMM|nr:hypothetical protein Tel_05235 [Candidatus Tenderia electrophaga]
MRQSLFEQSHADEWQRFETMLASLERNSKPPAGVVLADFPAAYRRLCHQLSLARQRHYSTALTEHLNQLVLRGHQQLYRRKSNLGSTFISFIVADFPALVRREWRVCTLASALLFLPALILYGFVLLSPELVYSVMPAQFVEQLESMYDPAAEHVGRPRDAGSDFAMFGHYIQNNIGISFRTFAGGILFGLGSIFFLVYNGALFGSIAAHIDNIDYHSTFFPFVVGHGAFELTAIALSGAAGLRLGYALIAPGRQTRLQALRGAAAVAVRIMYGVMLMLLIAAFVEAFWSSAVMNATVKYSVGAALWLFVLFYFLRTGRGHAV